jgi:hypothetical protein
VSGDWKAATWDPPNPASSRYFAQCLVGPGGATTLAAGTWYVWVKITDSPEIPVRPASYIVVS